MLKVCTVPGRRSVRLWQCERDCAGREGAKKPTAEECKKDPKMAGCEKKEEKK